MEEAAKRGEKLNPKDKRTPTSTVLTGSWNMSSSLANFFGFFKIYKGTMIRVCAMMSHCAFVVGLLIFMGVCVCVCVTLQMLNHPSTTC